METYIIRIEGLYYALGMDDSGDYVYALEAPNRIVKIDDKGDYLDARARAVLSVCEGYGKWMDAFHMARRGGTLRGEFYPMIACTGGGYREVR